MTGDAIPQIESPLNWVRFRPKLMAAAAVFQSLLPIRNSIRRLLNKVRSINKSIRMDRPLRLIRND